MYMPIPPADQTEKPGHQDTLQRFRLALSSLSDTEQNLFYLRYYQELPIKELAARYGLTPHTIRRQLRGIISKLDQSYLAQLAG